MGSEMCIRDRIDTGGSMINAAEAAIENGASSAFALATHGLFSGEASKRFMDSSIEEVIVTDTAKLDDNRRFEKLEVISVSSLFANAIANIHSGESVSELFDV